MQDGFRRNRDRGFFGSVRGCAARCDPVLIPICIGMCVCVNYSQQLFYASPRPLDLLMVVPEASADEL